MNMNLKKIAKKCFFGKGEEELDAQFLELDKKYIRRCKNLRLIPNLAWRKGGKAAYSEWGYVTGLFQTLLYQELGDKTDSKIIDFGCGSGLLGIPSEPFVLNKGKYFGLDAEKENVDFCRKNYDQSYFSFGHLEAHNSMYSPNQKQENCLFPAGDEEYDVLISLSVWTHLNESDAFFYIKEASRVLKKGGKAIISFFYLDEELRFDVKKGSNSCFHKVPKRKLVFNKNAYGSNEWLTPEWTNPHEQAIGITEEGMKKLLKAGGLEIRDYYSGSWKEKPGIFFQDMLVLERVY